MSTTMRRLVVAAAVGVIGVVGVLGCQTGGGGGSGGTGGPDLATTVDSLERGRLYDGIEGNHRKISTDSARAQEFFDQGLLFVYAFNHDEAMRSFREAARLDPDHPMPWWGVAHANGPHVNNPQVSPQQWRDGSEAIERAMERIENGTPLEAELIRAEAARWTWPPPAEQRAYDEAYAAAMEKVWRAHPDDPDVATMFAEALMNMQPWDYWTNDGAEKGRIGEAIAALERGMRRYPNHPGLAHFYIHAVEASETPERAVAAAERLERQVPGAGHLVHMPSHIYLRVGRYSDAADANVLATEADERYLGESPDQMFFWLYAAHNMHFLSFASMMECRYETAMESARALERMMPEEVVKQLAWIMEGILPTTYHVMIRFGKWEDVLAEPKPAEHRLVSRAVHHYARGIAYSALGEPDKAREEIELFEEAAAEIPGDWWLFNNKVDAVLPIARQMLKGELAFREGSYDTAFAALRKGVEMEDALVYDEPPGWVLPVRHALGALLMSAGRFAEAEEVYREDLKHNPDNGWSLLGLSQALAEQGEMTEARRVEARLVKAWPRADMEVTSSCLCEPRPQWRRMSAR